MRSVIAFLLGFALIAGAPAHAQECPGNRDALGTSRVLVVDPSAYARLGVMQYPESLPLADKEVVLTFDDGPLPPYTDQVLDTLAAECVKATFFLVGRMANAFPDTVRRIYNSGQTIGTHSQNHPRHFQKLPAEKSEEEIDNGIASVTAALGDARALAPFFRIPGLSRAEEVERQLAAHSLVAWSADLVADDWQRHIKASEIIRRAMTRLEARGKGILLLHDIHPATAIALSGLLKELKKNGYHVVQVVPGGEDRPKAVLPPSDARHAGRAPWPRFVASIPPNRVALPAPGLQDLDIAQPFGPKARTTAKPSASWPAGVTTALTTANSEELPAPNPQDIGVPLQGRRIVGEALGLRPSIDVPSVLAPLSKEPDIPPPVYPR